MEEKQDKKIDKFVHLHVHSTYSFQDAIGLPEQYAKRVSELGQPAIAITDHGNISAHYKWYKKMNKVGVKPILGCEFYVMNSEEYQKENYYNHITVIAKNKEGYKNLTTLVTKSWQEQFYYKPKILVKDLIEHQKGLIVLSGCLSGIACRLIEGGQTNEAEKWMLRMKENIEHFYAEVMPINYEEGQRVYRGVMDIAKQNNIPLVATMDCHYINNAQNKLHEILLCIQSKDVMSNPYRRTYNQDDFYLKTREEMERDLALCFLGVDMTEALDNTVKIADMVDFAFPSAKPISFPMEESFKQPRLVEMCEIGLKNLGIIKGHEKYKEYHDRMMYELDLIVKKNFIDYFLVIADLIQWAKKQGILVGPGRGSAAGSLCCYLLKITEVDPIEYDLIFERFIDLNREDLPDVDIDFEDVRRHEVKEYLEKKYGHDKVGNLPTFAYFKSKNCLQDIGRVFQIPHAVVNGVKKVVVERSGGDSRASFTLIDTFTNPLFEFPRKAMEQYPNFKYAIELEGQIRQMGQHAAGVIISNEPITNFCAIYKVRGENVLSLDYKDATDIGLLKIDILGLNTLSVVSKTIREIEERKGVKINPYEMKFLDPKVYDGFKKGKLFGVFQFDGQAVNQVCRQIQPDNFSSLYDISALARPGPLNSGSATLYIQRRAGKEKVKYAHALTKPFTEQTYGIVIYQEQVMRTMREVGGMSWKDTAEIRKAISKSQGLEAFNKYHDSFSVGALKNGVTQKEIDTIWDAICTFGSWAFNKSHSVSYSVISYWTMYLKVYYPVEFYASILSLVTDEDKKKKILKEYKKEGLKVFSIDINKSKRHFSIEEEGIRIGFRDIKKVGEKAADSILANQPYADYEDFDRKIDGQKVNMPVRQALINIGAFDELPKKEQTDLFGTAVNLYPKTDITFDERFHLSPWDMDFQIKKKWRQFYIDHKHELFNKFPTPLQSVNEQEGKEDVVVWGIAYDKNLRDKKEVSLSKGRKDVVFKEGEPTAFCNFILEDDTDFITVRLGVKTFPKYDKLIFEHIKGDDVIVCKGWMGSGIRMFFANEIVSLRALKEAYDKIEAQKNL